MDGPGMWNLFSRLTCSCSSQAPTRPSNQIWPPKTHHMFAWRYNSKFRQIQFTIWTNTIYNLQSSQAASNQIWLAKSWPHVTGFCEITSCSCYFLPQWVTGENHTTVVLAGAGHEICSTLAAFKLNMSPLLWAVKTVDNVSWVLLTFRCFLLGVKYPFVMRGQFCTLVIFWFQYRTMFKTCLVALQHSLAIHFKLHVLVQKLCTFCGCFVNTAGRDCSELDLERVGEVGEWGWGGGGTPPKESLSNPVHPCLLLSTQQISWKEEFLPPFFIFNRVFRSFYRVGRTRAIDSISVPQHVC